MESSLSQDLQVVINYIINIQFKSRKDKQKVKKVIEMLEECKRKAIEYKEK